MNQVLGVDHEGGLSRIADSECRSKMTWSISLYPSQLMQHAGGVLRCTARDYDNRCSDNKVLLNTKVRKREEICSFRTTYPKVLSTQDI
jgi:hypothetical protein